MEKLRERESNGDEERRPSTPLGARNNIREVATNPRRRQQVMILEDNQGEVPLVESQRDFVGNPKDVGPRTDTGAAVAQKEARSPADAAATGEHVKHAEIDHNRVDDEDDDDDDAEWKPVSLIPFGRAVRESMKEAFDLSQWTTFLGPSGDELDVCKPTTRTPRDEHSLGANHGGGDRGREPRPERREVRGLTVVSLDQVLLGRARGASGSRKSTVIPSTTIAAPHVADGAAPRRQTTGHLAVPTPPSKCPPVNDLVGVNFLFAAADGAEHMVPSLVACAKRSDRSEDGTGPVDLTFGDVASGEKHGARQVQDDSAHSSGSGTKSADSTRAPEPRRPTREARETSASNTHTSHSPVASPRTLRLQRFHEDHERKVEEYERSKARQENAEFRKDFVRLHSMFVLMATWAKLVSLAQLSSALVETVTSLGLVDKHKRRSFLNIPRIALRMRQLLRRARQHIVMKKGAGIPRPTLSQLKADKMLSLFPDPHLLFAIRAMELRYYFANELVVVMGSEDDEAYVLHEGSADVLIGKAKVFTLRGGMCFGVVGMISGEPRTATIITREACLVWVLRRAAFNEYSGGSNDSQVAAAQHAIAELRQANFLNVYKRLLEPSSLRTYPAFKDVGDETLSAFVRQDSVPLVVRCGNTLVRAGQAPSLVSPLLVLRGNLVVKVSESAWKAQFGARSTVESVGEVLRHAFDVPQKLGFRNPLSHNSHSRGSGSTGGNKAQENSSGALTTTAAVPPLSAQHPALTHRTATLDDLVRKHQLKEATQSMDSQKPPLPRSTSGLEKPSALGHDRRSYGSIRRSKEKSFSEHESPVSAAVSSSEYCDSTSTTQWNADTLMEVCRVSAPVVLSLSPLLLGQTTPFTVEATSDCDVLTLSRATLRQQDVLDIATLRQNCLNFKCEFFPTVTRGELLTTVFGSVMTSSEPSKALSYGVSATLHQLQRLGETVQHAILREEPWMYGCGEIVEFVPQNDLLIHVVLAGELEKPFDHLGPPPYVWPPLELAWFACNDLRVKVKGSQPLQVIRFRRCDLLYAVARELLDVGGSGSGSGGGAGASSRAATGGSKSSAQQREALAGLSRFLAARVSKNFGISPTFSTFGLNEVSVRDLGMQNSLRMSASSGESSTRSSTSATYAQRSSVRHRALGGSASVTGPRSSHSGSYWSGDTFQQSNNRMAIFSAIVTESLRTFQTPQNHFAAPTAKTALRHSGNATAEAPAGPAKTTTTVAAAGDSRVTRDVGSSLRAVVNPHLSSPQGSTMRSPRSVTAGGSGGGGHHNHAQSSKQVAGDPAHPRGIRLDDHRLAHHTHAPFRGIARASSTVVPLFRPKESRVEAVSGSSKKSLDDLSTVAPARVDELLCLLKKQQSTMAAVHGGAWVGSGPVRRATSVDSMPSEGHRYLPIKHQAPSGRPSTAGISNRKVNE